MDAKVVCVFLVVVLVIVLQRGVASVNRCPCKRKARTLVNECENSTLNNCDSNATCFDLNIGFACRCNDGFIGNGSFCAEDCDGTPCFGDNRECYRGMKCDCSPGFHNLHGECVEACGNYSDSFIDYQMSALFCEPRFISAIVIDMSASCDTYGDSFIDYQQVFLSCWPVLIKGEFKDLSGCQSVFLNQTGCISILFNPFSLGNNCDNFGCDPQSPGTRFTQVPTGFSASVRNYG